MFWNMAVSEDGFQTATAHCDGILCKVVCYLIYKDLMAAIRFMQKDLYGMLELQEAWTFSYGLLSLC